MNFNNLIDTISRTQITLQRQALQSVNQYLTIRNWLIGYYIIKYEQFGKDRAKYGDRLLDLLSKRLKKKRLKGFSSTNLKLFRKFYSLYPHIGNYYLSQEAFSNPLLLPSIGQTVSDQFRFLASGFKKSQTLSDKSLIIKKDLKQPNSSTPSELLLQYFSFSHFIEFIQIEEPLKRTFYELEAIKGCWSVRQLNRQIESLLYERTGLSKNKRKTISSIGKKRDKFSIEDTIKDPYVLEFTGYLNYYKNNIMHKNDNHPVGIIFCTDKNTTHVEYALDGLNNKMFVSKYKIALPTEKVLKDFIKNDIERLRNNLLKKNNLHNII